MLKINRGQTETREMTEENVYANVASITGEIKGFHVEEAPRRRSKVTVRRVALVVLSVLLLAAVGVIIGVLYYHQGPAPTNNAKAMTETTTVEGFTEITTTQGYTTKAVSPCSSVAQCDEDWELHGTKCFYFSPKSLQLPWTSSREKCRSYRGDLVKIESREEQEFLDGRVHRLMDSWDERFWMGLTDSETEGEWLWPDGSPLDQTLAFWTNNSYNTEPDNWKEEDENGENCAVIGEIQFRKVLNSWYDVSCKKKNRFICEKTVTTTCG